jgi:hypothetical protein
MRAGAWNTRLLWALLLWGCGASVVRPSQLSQDPVLTLTSFQRSRERLRSIRAEARVDQRGSDGRVRGTVLMLVQRPDQVRFDVMTQFGPAAILTSDGHRFAFSDLRQGRFLVGDTCSANIARLLNLPLTVEQTTLLLLGGTPVIGHDGATIAWNDAGFYRVELEGHEHGRQQIDLAVDERDKDAPPDRQRLRLRRSEIFGVDGKSRWRASYDDFKDQALDGVSVSMPFEVRIEQPQLDRDTLIRFKQISMNVDLPADAFLQTARAGQSAEEASCDPQDAQE